MNFNTDYCQAMKAVSIPDGLKKSVTAHGYIPHRKKKRTKRIVSLMVIITLSLALATTAVAVTVPLIRYGFLVNNNNQTYGTVKDSVTMDDLLITEENTPDLIACIGLDGTHGYCYWTDLEGEQPNNPEEAMEYMERLNERLEEMKINGEEYVRIIPLYAEDGVTVIGEFGISAGGSGEAPSSDNPWGD